MSFEINPNFDYETYKKVINNYEFPITDLETAVKFLNELPKECSVDFRESIKYCNLHSVQAVEGMYNVLALCNNFENDKDLYKVHIMFRDISIVEKDNYAFIVVRSGDGETASDIYINNDYMVLNPSTDYMYYTILKQL